jgi:hypothetical protein
MSEEIASATAELRNGPRKAQLWRPRAGPRSTRRRSCGNAFQVPAGDAGRQEEAEGAVAGPSGAAV